MTGLSVQETFPPMGSYSVTFKIVPISAISHTHVLSIENGEEKQSIVKPFRFLSLIRKFNGQNGFDETMREPSSISLKRSLS